MIFHIPHSSTAIPAEVRGSIVLDDVELDAEILAMTDHFTDELFGSFAGAKDSVAQFGVSRLVVDVERFPDDSQETMAERGMGVVYTRTSKLGILRNPISSAEREALLNKYYWPHHQNLEDCVKSALETEGYAFVLDCHSFPSRVLPYEDAHQEQRPDFCLGTDEYHTPTGLVELVKRYFDDIGYRVAIDTPFSGALVPSGYFRTDKSVSALMIEVNRKLYMNETTGHKDLVEFKRTKEVIGNAIELIQAYFDSDIFCKADVNVNTRTAPEIKY